MLLEVLYAGVCATDREIVRSGWPGLNPGIVLGHEIVARVVAAPGVTRYSTGDRVVIDAIIGCRTCVPLPGQHGTRCGHTGELGFHFDGGWAEFVVVGEAQLHSVPPGVESVDAALVEPLVGPASALLVDGTVPASSVAVIGSGIAALNFVQCARWLGADSITAFIRPRREGLFREFGADKVVDAESDPMATHCRFDLVIDAIGTAATARASVGLVRDGGRVLWYGIRDEETGSFPIRDIVVRNVTITGMANAVPAYASVLNAVASGRLRVDGLVDLVLVPADVPGFVQRPRWDVLKAVVDCRRFAG